MPEYLVVAYTLGAVAVLKLLVLLVAGGGSLSRWGQAVSAFFAVMGDAAKAKKVADALTPPPPAPAKAPRLSGEPLRLLELLQRDEGRLLDFVLEDVAAAPDDQLGAGVRSLHAAWQKVVKEHLTLEPVMNGTEGDTVTVPAGFDPSAIRVTGNVTGTPPFKGVLRHHGWRVKAYKLPKPPEGTDDLVMAPAEVEMP